ncbi:MAG: CsbD family protein [Opitutaceae bacterium]|nr:CsbD family protein [Opitutaceae bacterium]
MRTSTKDRVSGIAKQASGKAKIAAGRATGNTRVRARGHAERIAGKVQKKMGDRERARGR